ncbi:hypothetical protein CVU76_00040 [Candidatus Dojkabacteria bacterium HGW-Dojkabacteria-1]|uniref:DNA ligase (ATP) n=1 Tax=Candidatus Dojkabacteria bacterium HGW-Dojkabacteria-1 TaxID=2013761 RepID=A0A2N2F2I8_9BACT|nr:MAG: hypothetical protein CVU76_00040 [Candidatus Dojkabacteria bacterium HGW-Dojkabacteria-1]
MKYLELAKFFEKIEGLSSRNEMTSEMASFLKGCDQKEAQIVAYLMLGRVAPLFVNAEFNYSEKSLINLLTEYTKENVSKKRKEVGDIGDTVLEVWEKYSKNSSNYDISDIYELLWKIVNTKGTGSINQKNSTILECLKKLSPLESKYFVRIICGELRLGLNARSMLDVYSVYLVGDKGLKDILEHAYGVCADIGYLAGIVVGENAQEKLNNVDVRLGTPILSRLVERVGSFNEIFERFEKDIIVQPKFDGLRCQIHKWSKGRQAGDNKTVWSEYLQNENISQGLFGVGEAFNSEVRLFTRNLEDVTEMFPEIVESARNLPMESFVLDSEIVGWDYKKGKFLSYQETMQRRRKYSIGEKSTDIPVKSFVFDLLYLDGGSLITKDTKKRLDSLENKFGSTTGGIELAESKLISSLDELKEYFNKCVNEGLEGIIVKQFEEGYKPGIRNFEWVKIKKSIEKDLVDTVDMVIVGYYYGSGRRSTLGLGAILCGIYNEKEDTIDAICKVGTGIGDDLLKEISIKLKEISLKDSPKNVRYQDSLKPDVWVQPQYVVTVDADEITKNISKGKKDIGGGLSLRFPRLIEFGRDKLVEDITTVEELVKMDNLRKNS